MRTGGDHAVQVLTPAGLVVVATVAAPEHARYLAARIDDAYRAYHRRR